MTLRQRPFRACRGATSVSNLGSGITLVALPILAAQRLSAGPAQFGYPRAAETLPYLVFALPVGQLADRLPPLYLMLTADVARALALPLTAPLPRAS